ncbi:conserved hypothetical protein [Histoplasma capsulatum var. duboisii H88]|uniref:YAG7-like dimerisation domain-containing protein n=1 Tax=Ajellomyces capsulatus (strain H88) TaxID=544711 RepID=F0UMB9_AJEC8|nr:conserved hypothetical protein [Histoplasma capsulatum var. duboisii H88]QSS54258.1 hypothetical protein I7I53_01758 [Histoplasma capsulatum var. duboisii H88]
MSAAVTNPLPQPDAKGAKKKRAKGENSSTVSGAVTDPPNPATPTTESAPNGVAGAHEPGFLKDLHKSHRNAVKKLNATSKVDNIIAENPNKSLDELVAEKKINADQKAQVLKKPSLQAAVFQIEEQINQYKQYGQYYEDRLSSQKIEIEKAHKDELKVLKEKVAAEILESVEKEFEQRLLVLSQFLRAAAAMRRSGDETSSDSRAFEGALFQVYGGTEEAVSAMVKLINGTDDIVPSVDAEPLDVPYSRVKQASLEYIPPTTEAWTEETQPSESASAAGTNVVTDPTIANAGLTELQDPPLAAQQAPTTNGFPTSGTPHPDEISSAPSQSAVNNETANPRAQMRWDNQGSKMSASTTAEGWVEIEKADVEGTSTTTATQGVHPTLPTSGSWAEDIPVQTSVADGASPEPNDGFKPVVSHHARQNSGRGRGFRGRGGPRGEGFRGRGGFRGDRGDYRGRGRGRGGEYRGRGGRGGYNNAQGPPQQSHAAPAPAEHTA